VQVVVKFTVKFRRYVGTVLRAKKRIIALIAQQYILQCNSVHIPQWENTASLFHVLQ